MKKLFLVAVIALSVSLTASAQALSVSLTASAQKLGFGVELGGNMSNLHTKSTIFNSTNTSSTDMKFGFQVGAFADYSITDNLFVKAHLLFFTKGGKDVTKLNTMTTTSTMNPMYIALPVVVGFGFDIGDIRPFINAGVYAAYGVGGKSKAKVEGAPIAAANIETSSDFFEDDVNAFDFGARFGAGVELSKKFIIEFNYDLGLMNLNSDKNTSDNVSIKNHSLSLTFGYRF